MCAPLHLYFKQLRSHPQSRATFSPPESFEECFSAIRPNSFAAPNPGEYRDISAFFHFPCCSATGQLKHVYKKCFHYIQEINGLASPHLSKQTLQTTFCRNSPAWMLPRDVFFPLFLSVALPKRTNFKYMSSPLFPVNTTSYNVFLKISTVQYRWPTQT